MIIFYRQNYEEKLQTPLVISGKEIEHKHEARFLEVIVDENLTCSGGFTGGVGVHTPYD